MKKFSMVIGALALVAILAPVPASAQQSNSGSEQLQAGGFYDVRPGLTTDEFTKFTRELGSVLRFRQLGDGSTLGKGRIELGVQVANPPINDSKGAWGHILADPNADHALATSVSIPQIVARFGVGDRVDIGAWGGLGPRAKYGVAGVDVKVAVLKQGPSMPVSLSVRPSFASLIGPYEIWVGTASADVTVSRSFGSLSPYAGLAGSSSLGIERSKDVILDPVSDGRSLAYVGLSYRVRALVLAGEMEKGTDRVSYAFRVTTRF